MDDLIAPNRDGKHRNPNQAIASFHLDLKALGLRKRRQHDCRRTFTSITRGDGAPGELVNWITHGPSGSINDAYTSMPWATLCDAVSKLVLELREGKLLKLTLRRVDLVELLGGVAQPECSYPAEKKKKNKQVNRANPSEVRGRRARREVDAG